MSENNLSHWNPQFAKTGKIAISANYLATKSGYEYILCVYWNPLARTKQMWAHVYHFFLFLIVFGFMSGKCTFLEEYQD